MHLLFLFICCVREACSKGVTNSSSLLLDFHLVLVVVLARYRCGSLWPIRRFAGSSSSASAFPELVVSVTRLVVAVAAMLSTASSATATSPASEGACVVMSLESILIYI